MAAGAGGCFPGDATVRLDTGVTRTMDTLAVGERVMTYDVPTEQFHYEPVIAWLHRSRAVEHHAGRYVTVHTDHGHRLTLTPGTPRTHILCTRIGGTSMRYRNKVLKREEK